MKKQLPLNENKKDAYTVGQYLKESKTSFNYMIDYTLLKPHLTIDAIKEHCEVAKENNCYAVCIYPEYVSTASAFLEDSKVKICTVISFPKGDASTIEKVREADKAISDGAEEIDMVLNWKKLKKMTELDSTSEEYETEYNDLLDDVKQVAYICHKNGVTLKVIIESGELTFEQIKIACDICIDGNADFVKTSTGFSPSGVGAELEKVKYMRKILPDYIKIKASGGIRSQEDVEKFATYVDRIGTSVIPGSNQKSTY